MNEEDMTLSYVAGVLDGDGSFSIIKKIENALRSPLYYPVIQLANACEDLVKMFHDKFGGSLFTRKARVLEDGGKRKPSHQWKLEKSNSCLPFLDKVIPYLIVKQERAKFLKEYIERNPFKRGSNKLSDDILLKRESDYLKMRQFNDEGTRNKPFHKNISCPTFWAYMAGLMDTDGSFSIRKEISKTHMKSPCYSPIISLSMIDPRAFGLILNNFKDGKVKIVKAKTCREGICYRFVISSSEGVIKFLNQIIPYLRVKPENAKVLLKFCEERCFVSYRKTGVPQEELDFRDKCYQDLCSLNKYGVYKSSLMDLEG